jgi:hypothetical protein
MTLHTSEAAASQPAPVEITLDEAKTLLARAVTEKGKDHKYKMLTVKTLTGLREEACAYFDPADGRPSCMVGYVLSYKGVTHESLAIAGLNHHANVETLAEMGFIKVDLETQALLEAVQSEQDAGMTWGDALEEALKTYEDVAAAYENDGRDNDPSEDYWL